VPRAFGKSPNSLCFAVLDLFEGPMKPKAGRKRLDLLIVERGFADSLQKAMAMILAGEVQVDGQRAGKAGMPVAQDAQIDVTSRLQKFVSRGGVKLEGALEDFAIEPSGCVCLDIGASNGGFTDCLLQHGAERVYAVDVNVGQLDWKLTKNPRVIPLKQNARDLSVEDLPELADLVVIDVSFISARKVIAPAVAVAKPAAVFLILVKPQFELPREDIGLGGIVKDQALHNQATQSVREYVESVGLDYLGVHPSRLLGAEGNQEYFLHARKKTLE
jgi:23S rRNA (cytidine1920-2'-O)/16S rRNA (cytidine1409-2'-O)-methyltransferase